MPGGGDELNQELERAGRVADFLELGELMCRDALAREESCGCHFRVEHQTADGEALRDDARFAHVAAWMPGAAGRERPSASSSRSTSRRCRCTSGRIDEDRAPRSGASTTRASAGGFVRYELDDVQRRDDAARGARPPQRVAGRARRAAGGLRQRLPRGDLRGLRHRGGRPPARAAAGHDHLSAAAAGVPRRRHDHARAVPHGRLPGRARPGRGPRRARPRRAGGRLRLGAGRQRARGQYACPVGRDAAERALDAADVHRLRRLRRRLPQRLRRRCSWGPSSPTSGSCPRASPSARAAPAPWWPPRTARASAAARSTASARPPAPRASTSASSRG